MEYWNYGMKDGLLDLWIDGAGKKGMTEYWKSGKMESWIDEIRISSNSGVMRLSWESVLAFPRNDLMNRKLFREHMPVTGTRTCVHHFMSRI